LMLGAAGGVGGGCSCPAAARSSASGHLARGRSPWRCTRLRRVRVDAPRGRSYVSAAPMTLALYNTLTRRVEPFAPLAPPRVTLYTCGPTVWNYAHIGNFRTFLFEDLLRRYLAYSGYDVFHIMNLTDVDDRTIKAAAAAAPATSTPRRIRATSRCGRRPVRWTSKSVPRGTRRSGGAGPGGTSSAPPCRSSRSGSVAAPRRSTYTPAAST